MSYPDKFKSVLLFLFSVFAFGCSSAERSAGMAIENAGGVIRDSAEKLWIDPASTATPIPSSAQY